MVYLDWNATAPPAEEVLLAMAAASREAWGNPSSVHTAGRAARARVEDAREAVAELCGADPRDVVLTSGGTEANNLGVRSAFASSKGALVTSRLEHPSVLRVAEALEREGRARVRWVRVEKSGRIDIADFARAMDEDDVRLVALQAVNQETGAVQEVDAVTLAAQARGARVHVDAVQAVGKIALAGARAETRAIAAHKFRGPKGIGALVTQPGLPIGPVLLGGTQERGVRPGTVDPVAAAGFAVAVRRAKASVAVYDTRVRRLRDMLERDVLARFPGSARNGDDPRAPHVANVFIPGWRGPELVAALDLEGVCVSSGSACSAGTTDASPVLRAMHDEVRAGSSLRFTLGDATEEEDVTAAMRAVERVAARRT
jgi:cysteine desulfurase